jgi:hypothetical protein
MRKLTALFTALMLMMPVSVQAYWMPETFGTVEYFDGEILRVTGMALTEHAMDDLFLYTPEAWIYDLRTGFPGYVTDIEDGVPLRAVYLPRYTGGEDTLVHLAAALYLYAGEPGAADLKVTVSENICYTEDGCTFVTQDGKYRIGLFNDTTLYNSLGARIDAWDILPGMEMFVWSAYVTASFPGQLVPEKIVLIEPF